MAFTVDTTEPAEADIQAAYLWLGRWWSPEFAEEWYRELEEAIAGLSFLPRRHPAAEDNAGYDVPVRQLIVGKGKAAFHVLFHVVEEEQVVRVLHVLHTARGPRAEGG